MSDVQWFPLNIGKTKMMEISIFFSVVLLKVNAPEKRTFKELLRENHQGQEGTDVHRA